MTDGLREAVAPATEADVALLRRKAAEFLKAYRDSGAGGIGIGPEERLPVSLGLMLGRRWTARPRRSHRGAGARPVGARRCDWRETPDPARLRDFTVTVIGAGMGGLNAALQLREAGFPFTVIEKNAGVGGTWWENRYPGARVDTPSRSYTHLFGVDFPYPNPFCEWRENVKYFDWVADRSTCAGTSVRDRGQGADLGRGGRRVGDRHRRAGRRERDDPLARGDHRASASSTARMIPEIAGTETFAGAVVAHGAVAAGRRPEGQAGRGDRHRLHRLPDDPRARARGRPRHRRSSGRRSGCSASRATGRRSRRRSTGSTATCRSTPTSCAPHARHPRRLRRASRDRSGLRRSVRRAARSTSGRAMRRSRSWSASSATRSWWRR